MILNHSVNSSTPSNPSSVTSPLSLSSTKSTSCDWKIYQQKHVLWCKRLSTKRTCNVCRCPVTLTKASWTSKIRPVTLY